MEHIAWLKELGKEDVASAGSKGANLGELVNAGFRVPAGFVLTAEAFMASMEDAGVRASLKEHLDEALSAPAEELGPVAEELRGLVAAAGTAFAGVHRTFPDIEGDDALVARVVECWVSLYGDRAISCRASQDLHDEAALAVVVQQNIQADRAGVMFTADPASGDRSVIVIEAAYGLGESVVSGSVQPDTYVVTKEGAHLVETHVGVRSSKIVPTGEGGDHHRGLLRRRDHVIAVRPGDPSSPSIWSEQELTPSRSTRMRSTGRAMRSVQPNAGCSWTARGTGCDGPRFPRSIPAVER